MNVESHDVRALKYLYKVFHCETLIGKETVLGLTIGATDLVGNFENCIY